MLLRLPLSGKRHATILSAYIPALTNPNEFKDKFYDDLDSVISATDKLILLGDFNASGHRPPILGRNWNWRSRKVQHQVPPPFKEVCRAWTTDHQDNLPSTNSQQNIMDVSLAPNIGISLTMSQCRGRTDRMSEWQRLCVVNIVEQISGLSPNSTCAFSLHGDHKARKCQRDWMSPSWNKTARGKHLSMISAGV